MKIIALIIGFAHGISVSASVAVFISVLGIAPQLAHVTRTGKIINFYGICIMLGVFLGSILDLLYIRLPYNFLSEVIFIIVLVFSGIFTGVLLSALAEVLDIMPAIGTLFKEKAPFKFLVIVLAISKIIGSLLYTFTPYFP